MAQVAKKTHVRMDQTLQRALKIAAIQADISMEQLIDEVIKEGMKVRGIPLPDRKPPKVHGRQSASQLQA